MQKIIDIIQLTAKTGLFFANCDGKYDDKEKDFIEGYIAGLEVIGDIDPQLKENVKASLDKTYTLDEITAETKQLLDGFNDEEQKQIIMAIDEFIRKLIRIDHRVDAAEKKNYAAWKRAFDLA